MEHAIVQALIQDGWVHSSGCLCTLWNWGFWIAVVVGVLGSVAALVMKPPQGS